MENKELKAMFGLGVSNDGNAQYFTGKSFLNRIVKPHDNIDYGVGVVTFEAGCRNNWHIHRGGYQILLVTDGEGWYQEWGKPAQKIKAGDVIVTHEGIKHWHGATATSTMSHVALTKGKAEWLEAVIFDEVSNVDSL